jgi:hypothetical protein
LQRLSALCRDSNGELGGLALDGIAPVGVEIAVFQRRFRERSERSRAETRLECSLSMASKAIEKPAVPMPRP